MNKTGAPHGKELGRINLCLKVLAILLTAPSSLTTLSDTVPYLLVPLLAPNQYGIQLAPIAGNPSKSSRKTSACLIMESLVKKKQKGAILELKRRHLKNNIFCTYTPYPAMKIRHISASSTQETRNDQFLIRRIHYNQYAVCTAVHQSKIRI
ncbi:hypothetical protein Tco_0630148 [Tanacetum coccineum]